MRSLMVMTVYSLSACGNPQPPVQYARAVPVEEEQTAPVAAPPPPSREAGAHAQPQEWSASFLPPTPPNAPKEATYKPGKAGDRVIKRANRAAAQGPQTAAFDNAIQAYVYMPGALYQVYAAPMRVTDIALRPGEKLIGQPVTGDSVRWVCAAGKSMEGGVAQEHIYLKPMMSGLQTNLVINTNERSYFLELHSYKETYMAAVKWRYPQQEMAQMAERASVEETTKRDAAPVVSLDHLNFSYRIVVNGESPKWTPTQVFDDGRRTFIRFPKAMLAREAPALFVVRDDQTQLVNYHVRRELYIVDRLIDVAELRVGQKEQEVVRIERVEGS